MTSAQPDDAHLVMVLPDLHIPHHDPDALGCVLAVHQLLRPARTVILGDWLDCEAFSRHAKGSRQEERAETYFAGEVQPAQRLLLQLEENTCELVYLEGNHEHRVERYVTEQQGVMLDLADLVSPRRLLSEGRTKPFTYVPYVPKPAHPLPHYRIARDLIAVHGWSFAKHAASKHLDIARCYSVVHGHTHRLQLHTSTDPITQQTYRAWSPGCLSRRQPLYMQHNPTDWVHGISLIWVSNDRRTWTDYTVELRDGRCRLPDGRVVDGRRQAKLVRHIERAA